MAAQFTQNETVLFINAAGKVIRNATVIGERSNAWGQPLVDLTYASEGYTYSVTIPAHRVYRQQTRI